MNAFEYIKEWYKSNCDGDWEHQYGIRINTLDNPGWEVRIDLAFEVVPPNGASALLMK